MRGYITDDVPFGSPDNEYPAYDTAACDNARPSSIAYDANEIDEYDSMFPTKNEEYPILVLDPTDQYTFLDNAPFLRIMDESSPIVSVVNV